MFKKRKEDRCLEVRNRDGAVTGTMAKERVGCLLAAGWPGQASPLNFLSRELFGKESLRKEFSLSFPKLHLPPPPHFKNQFQPPKEGKEK